MLSQLRLADLLFTALWGLTLFRSSWLNCVILRIGRLFGYRGLRRVTLWYLVRHHRLDRHDSSTLSLGASVKTICCKLINCVLRRSSKRAIKRVDTKTRLASISAWPWHLGFVLSALESRSIHGCVRRLPPRQALCVWVVGSRPRY